MNPDKMPNRKLTKEEIKQIEALKKKIESMKVGKNDKGPMRVEK